MSLIESGGLVVRSKKLPLVHVIHQSVQLYSIYANKKGIELETEIPENPYVMADEDLTLKIINNLVNNALKYTNEGSILIRLESTRTNGQK